MGVQRKPVIYINNETFLQEIKKYIALREQAVVDCSDPPRVPDSIGSAIIQIATRLATRHNFNGYTYKEEMVSDGILNALEAVDSFNPEKSSNPFAYFTQVIFWAFLRRIEKEKKEKKTRDDLMFDDYEGFTTQEGDDFALDKSELYMFYHN